jgi:hypothetical protein
MPEKILITFGSGTVDTMIRREPKNGSRRLDFVLYECDDIGTDRNDLDQKKVLAGLVATVRGVEASAVLLGMVQNNLPYARIDIARFLLDGNPSVTAVFTYSVKQLSEGWEQQGIFDLAIFKIERCGISVIGQWEGVIGGVLWGMVLNKIEWATGAVAAA